MVYLENKNCSDFNIKIVKKIFDNIKKEIKENVSSLHNSISNDNKEFFENFEYKNLLEIVENVEKEEWLIEKSSNTKIYTGIGNIGVCYNGTPEITLYMILKALKTNNNITFLKEKNLHKTSEILIDIAKKVCKSNNYDVNFGVLKYEKISELCNDSLDFDMVIFINENQNYLEFLQNDKNVIKTICKNYGKIELYLDDKNLKDILLKMDDYVYKNNIELEIYKDEKIEDAVSKINTKINNDCAVIFTKDKEKAYYFIKHINAEKIFVNKNPEQDNKFWMKDEEFLVEKRVFI